MPRIKRVRDVQIVELMEPNLVFFDESHKLPFLAELVQRMTQLPESVFVLAAFEGNELIGHVIAQDPGVSVSFANVCQAYSATGNPPTVANEMMFQTLVWASSLGKTSLRAETSRDEALFRRFGFEPAERIVRYKIDPEFQRKLYMKSLTETL